MICFKTELRGAWSGSQATIQQGTECRKHPGQRPRLKVQKRVAVCPQKQHVQAPAPCWKPELHGVSHHHLKLIPSAADLSLEHLEVALAPALCILHGINVFKNYNSRIGGFQISHEPFEGLRAATFACVHLQDWAFWRRVVGTAHVLAACANY